MVNKIEKQVIPDSPKILLKQAIAVHVNEEKFGTKVTVNGEEQSTWDADSKLDKSGGTFTGEIVIGQGDGKGVQLGEDGRFNATYSGNPNYTVLGMIDKRFVLGSDYIPIIIRGNTQRPKYKNANSKDVELALYSDIPTSVGAKTHYIDTIDLLGNAGDELLLNYNSSWNVGDILVEKSGRTSQIVSFDGTFGTNATCLGYLSNTENIATHSVKGILNTSAMNNLEILEHKLPNAKVGDLVFDPNKMLMVRLTNYGNAALGGMKAWDFEILGYLANEKPVKCYRHTIMMSRTDDEVDICIIFELITRWSTPMTDNQYMESDLHKGVFPVYVSLWKTGDSGYRYGSAIGSRLDEDIPSSYIHISGVLYNDDYEPCILDNEPFDFTYANITDTVTEI